MIVFKNIRWRNLLSTGNYWTEIALNKNQNTLIIGENGSGKSTILDAICFALFGKAFRNINKPNLVNAINQKELVVEITFDTNEKSYRIVRGIKPNIFEIYCDGDLLNQDAASKDYQDLLEKSILKLNYKSFTQIVILGSASFTPFMQLSAADRRAIIEDLLDIQVFSTMNNLFKDRLSVNKESTIENKYTIDLLQQKYNLHSKYLNDVKENNKNKIEQYKLEIEDNNLNISTLDKQNNSYLEKINNINLIINEKIDIQTTIKKITKLESQIENNLCKFHKDVSLFQEHDNCPTCRQTIITEFKEKELLSLNNKIGENEQALKQLSDKLKKYQDKLNVIALKEKEIQDLQVKTATNNASISQIKKYNVKLENQIQELKDAKQISDKEETELKQIQSDLDLSNEDLKKLIDEKSYIEIALTLLKDTGIKTKIIRQYLPVINKLVNKYLASLDFFVNFNLDESFKETIKSRFRDEFTYNNFSEGEKQKIDISLLLTWRAVSKLKNSTNTNLLILDEIFDSSLDSNGTEYLMNILHMLDGTNLFVISHKTDILQDKFANVIKFHKNKNFSHIAN